MTDCGVMLRVYGDGMDGLGALRLGVVWVAPKCSEDCGVDAID